MTASISPAASVVRAAAAGERREFFGGGVHTWMVRAAETDGAFFLSMAEG